MTDVEIARSAPAYRPAAGYYDELYDSVGKPRPHAAALIAGLEALGPEQLAAARPDLPQSALRDALTQSAPRPSLLSGLLGGGSLNVGAAMHRILPGSQWKDSPTQNVALPLDESQATLEVSSKKRVRKGRAATVRWTATGAASVVQWRVSLNGKRISTVPGTKTALRKRVNKAGTNRWKVVGLDAEGETVVAATRKFKVVTAR
jgi:hypothetical protein